MADVVMKSGSGAYPEVYRDWAPFRVTTIPTAQTLAQSALWMPFAAQFAAKDEMPLSYLVEQVVSGEATLHVVFAGETPIAAATTRIQIRHGSEKVGELYWLAGERMAEWLPMFVSEIEAFLRRAGCAVFKMIPRDGFERVLKPFGYRRTKVVLEKKANHNG
jgi:hypothetical protein